MDYRRKTPFTSDLLKLITRSATGRGLLERFLPLLNRGTVKIESYPAEIVSKLRAVIPEGHPIGACLVTEGDSGTIFLDFESPIGVLAPFLVHEIVHALQTPVWAGETLRLKKTLMETESEAFRVQHLFIQEMKERDPAYAQFLLEHYPKAKMLHQLLEFEDIELLYGHGT